MVIQIRRKCRKLIVVQDDRKAFLTVLPDEWFDDGESLTRAWCAHYPCTSKGIDNVYPSLSKLTLIIVAHGDIHTVVIGLQILALFKTLVLEVEMVFQQSFLQELADVVQGYMHQSQNNKVVPNLTVGYDFQVCHFESN